MVNKPHLIGSGKFLVDGEFRDGRYYSDGRFEGSGLDRGYISEPIRFSENAEKPRKEDEIVNMGYRFIEGQNQFGHTRRDGSFTTICGTTITTYHPARGMGIFDKPTRTTTQIKDGRAISQTTELDTLSRFL